MPQYILLQSYTGLSTFTYEATSTGRKLALVTSDQLDRHGESDYVSEWYEVSPGDTITIELVDYTHKEVMEFTVPPGGLPDPPTSLDDLERTAPRTHKYLKRCCK